VGGQADQGAPVPGIDCAFERGPGQFRLVMPQQVTEIGEGLAVTGLKLLPVIPAQDPGCRRREPGISLQAFLDVAVERVPSSAAVGPADHDPQPDRDRGARLCAAEDQPGQIAAGSLRPADVPAISIGQHAVAECPDRLQDEPRSQIRAGHPSSCLRPQLIAHAAISHCATEYARVR